MVRFLLTICYLSSFVLDCQGMLTGMPDGLNLLAIEYGKARRRELDRKQQKEQQETVVIAGQNEYELKEVTWKSQYKNNESLRLDDSDSQQEKK